MAGENTRCRHSRVNAGRASLRSYYVDIFGKDRPPAR